MGKPFLSLKTRSENVDLAKRLVRYENRFPKLTYEALRLLEKGDPSGAQALLRKISSEASDTYKQAQAHADEERMNAAEAEYELGSLAEAEAS